MKRVPSLKRISWFSMLFLGASIWLVSCKKSTEEPKTSFQLAENTLFRPIDSKNSGIDFINKVEDSDEYNILTYRNFYNGGGVAIGDINNDGLNDIFFTANREPNRLYLNKGNWEFEDITEQAGISGTKAWSTGVTMVDINGDGWLDIYVCNSGDVAGDDKENEFFINQKDLTFIDKAADMGLNDKGYSTHAAFFDYDRDGDLDCYLLNNSVKDPNKIELRTAQREVRDPEGGDKLLRNDTEPASYANDELTFTDVSEEAGIFGSVLGFGLGVTTSDINEDGWPDIYISNDFWERDYCYINQKNGQFKEEIGDRMQVISGSSMGSDAADINNDGLPEIFTTDMLPANNYRLKAVTRFDEFHLENLKVRSNYHYQLIQNCLHLNKGDGKFQEIAFLSGVAATDWSWGALIFDFDNDGWRDIFVSNGIYNDITSGDFGDFISDRANINALVRKKGDFKFEYLKPYLPSMKISNFAFKNQRNLTFKDETRSLGLDEPGFSNGAAYGDLDNDGDLDLVINNVNMTAFVYRNTSDETHKPNYINFSLKGNSPNVMGIGAKVNIHAGEKMQTMQHFTARGFQSSMAPGLLFGLGNVSVLDSAVIEWPNGDFQVIKGIEVNQTLVVDQENVSPANQLEKESESKTWMTDVTPSSLIGDITHQENIFNDFNHERLMPRMHSTEGPKIITGDINGDQWDDFIMLGAMNDADKVFIRIPSGKFKQINMPSLSADSSFESTCGILIDTDGDNDLDLIIGSGGNEKPDSELPLRYYLNNGQGSFQKIDTLAPQAKGQFSVIKGNDFDKDGDIDLFIGGRSIPGNYGIRPQSYLYLNGGNNRWAKITPDGLLAPGMVTDAAWSDVDKDGWDDLIVVGEWMPVMIFRNTGKSLANDASVLPGSEGWWTSIRQVDLNNDGNEDFILGNWGLNSKFTASDDRPMTMYVNDFDKNGKSEFIINWYPPTDSIPYPFASKMDMTAQMPLLKKNNIRYDQYAVKTYEELIAEDQRKGAMAYVVKNLSSVVMLNNGNFKFQFENLPIEAQSSPIFAIEAQDFNHDGNIDLFVGGNFYGLKPEVGRLDGSRGVLLKGNGSGSFETVSEFESGINIPGEIRDAKSFKGMNGKLEYLLIARNNGELKILNITY